MSYVVSEFNNPVKITSFTLKNATRYLLYIMPTVLKTHWFIQEELSYFPHKLSRSTLNIRKRCLTLYTFLWYDILIYTSYLLWDASHIARSYSFIYKLLLQGTYNNKCWLLRQLQKVTYNTNKLCLQLIIIFFVLSHFIWVK